MKTKSRSYRTCFFLLSPRKLGTFSDEDQTLIACAACSWRSLGEPCSVDCSCKSHRFGRDGERLGNQDDETSKHQSTIRLSWQTPHNSPQPSTPIHRNSLGFGGCQPRVEMRNLVKSKIPENLPLLDDCYQRGIRTTVPRRQERSPRREPRIVSAHLLTATPKSIMKFAYFDCLSGIAGDMAVAALLDAGASLSRIQDTLLSMGLTQASTRLESTQRAAFGQVGFLSSFRQSMPIVICQTFCD